MGEVYRARDTRLDRTVGLKILAPGLASDTAFKQRFEREARTISSIEHPHICAIYDVGEHAGTSFIVMQYLEGQTLAERIAAGTRGGKLLPLGEALAIAAQIAGALDRAHRAGIVHRDVKPANIMLTRTGAKLLDFGLAKSAAPAVSTASGASIEATELAPQITERGTILGTFQYMAPEQVEGRDADARADIFAMGVVLYEMLTGRKAFEAPTHAGLIAAILEREPPPISKVLSGEQTPGRDRPMVADAQGLANRGWTPGSVQALDRILSACLAKDPEVRLQSAHDLALQLRWVAEGVDAAAAPAPAPAPARAVGRPVREWAAWGLFGAAAIAAAALATVMSRRPAPEARPVRFAFTPTPAAPFSVFGASPNPALSPDGRHITYETTNARGDLSLAVRALDQIDAQLLPGTDDADFPFWSADGRFIAFFAQRKLKKIPVDGGPVQNVCDVLSVAGGTWNREGTILYGGGRRGIQRVQAAGGSPTAATTLDAAQNEAWHEWPSFLPDGKHFLYTAGPPGVVYVGSLDSAARVKVTESDSKALYAAPGYLVFMRQGVLLAQPFDAAKGTLSGEAVPLAPNVGFDLANTRAAAAFSVSEAGVLAYRTGTAAAVSTQMRWFDRAGKPLETVGAPASFLGMDLSPDDSRIAAHRHDPEGGDLWIIDARTGAASRFTFDATRHYSSPFWSRDGSRIGYATTVAPKLFLYQKPSSGAGSDDTLDTTDLGLIPGTWTPDNTALVYSRADLKTRWDIWVAPVEGDRKPRPLIATPVSEMLAQISPDGRWIAYQSDGTGRPEIYVQPYPSLNGKWQVSANGGTHVRWRKDGRELYYLGANSTITAVDVLPDRDAFKHGPPAALFAADVGSDYGVNYPYAVSSDGRRILVETVVKDVPPSPMVVAVNWIAALKK